MTAIRSIVPALVALLLVFDQTEIQKLAAAPAAEASSYEPELLRTLEGILDKERFAAVRQFTLDLLERTRTNSAGITPATATTLDVFGGMQFKAANFSKAAVFFAYSLKIRERLLDAGGSPVALSLNNLGIACQALGNVREAERMHRRALAIYEQSVGGRHPDTATALFNLALVHNAKGELDQAESLLIRGVDIFEATKGPSAPETISALGGLGLLLQQKGELGKAGEAFERSLRASQARFGTTHPETAQAMKNLGVLRFHLGDLKQAEEWLTKSLKICEGALGSEHPQTAVVFTSLGELYRTAGEFERALPKSRQGLLALEKSLGPLHHETLKATSNLGLLLHALGNYDQAERFLRASLSGYERTIGTEAPDAVLAMNNLGLLYRDMADYEKAGPLLTRCLQAYERHLGSTHPSTARALNNLALLHEQRGDYEQAEPLLKRAVVINESRFGTDHPTTATLLANLGNVYCQLRRHQESEAVLTKSLAMHERTLGRTHPGVAFILRNLGHLYAQTGDFARAEPLFQRGLSIIEAAEGPDHDDAASILENLASLKLDLGRPAEALALERRCRKITEKNWRMILSFASERQRFGYQNARGLSPLAIMGTLGSASDIAEIVLRTKGIVLDSLLEDDWLAASSTEAAFHQLRDQLMAVGRRLTKLQIEAGDREQPVVESKRRDELQALEQTVESLQAMLARNLGDRDRVHGALRVTIPEVQSALPSNAILVEVVRYRHYLGMERWENRYGAVVFGAKGVTLKGGGMDEVVWVSLGAASAIETNVADYLAAMRGERHGEASLLQSLARQLVQPIQSHLPSGITTWIISASADLNFLNFGTLLEAHGTFLAERYRFYYVSSGRDLLMKPTMPPTSRTCAVFANPAFDLKRKLDSPPPSRLLSTAERTSSWRDYNGLSLAVLPNTAREADYLQERGKQWGTTVQSFTAQHATEASLRRLRSPQILHLATHGFVLPSASAKGGPSEAVVFSNPMQRSGLALAGAQATLAAWKQGEVPDPDDDGILMAQEVGLLDLKDTWLVVLSACDTGLGEARNGEGVLGLRRGFVQAGAQNLLMTLWPISDKWSVEIMKSFYDKAMASGDAPQAMAEVQAEWLAKLRKEKGALLAARIAGPFVLTSRGKVISK